MARLRERADNMAASAAAMKKIADAADPLYKTLDDGQKRRLAILTHHGRFGDGEGGWRHRWMERGMDRDPDRDRRRRQWRCRAALRRDRAWHKSRKSRRNPAAVAAARVLLGGKNPPALLDIGGSLC